MLVYHNQYYSSIHVNNTTILGFIFHLVIQYFTNNSDAFDRELYLDNISLYQHCSDTYRLCSEINIFISFLRKILVAQHNPKYVSLEMHLTSFRISSFKQEN